MNADTVLGWLNLHFGGKKVSEDRPVMVQVWGQSEITDLRCFYLKCLQNGDFVIYCQTNKAGALTGKKAGVCCKEKQQKNQ